MDYLLISIAVVSAYSFVAQLFTLLMLTSRLIRFAARAIPVFAVFPVLLYLKIYSIAFHLNRSSLASSFTYRLLLISPSLPLTLPSLLSTSLSLLYASPSLPPTSLSLPYISYSPLSTSLSLPYTFSSLLLTSFSFLPLSSSLSFISLSLSSISSSFLPVSLSLPLILLTS